MLRSLVTSCRFSRFSGSFLRVSVGFRVLQGRTIMVNNSEVLENLEQRAKQADELVDLLKSHLQALQKAAEKQQSPSSQAQIVSLNKENEKLKGEASKLKKELEYWEIRNGVKQVALPSVSQSQQTPTAAATPTTAQPTPPAPAQPEQQQEKKNKKAEKKGKAEKTEKPKKNAGAGGEVSISRLDFRVGKVISVKRHPDADSLFVEEIDVGEENPRTICTGLVGKVEMSEIQDAMVLVMCNLKPVKMRGILSQGMVMCANKDNVWSLVVTPPGAVQGDRFVFEGYPGEPDQQLNPKKKVWETLAPELKTNSEGIPNFKGIPFNIPDKGICTTKGVKDGVVR